MKKYLFSFLLVNILFISVYSQNFNTSVYNSINELKNNKISFSTISLEGYVSFWIQKSSGDIYSLPYPIKKKIPVKVELKIYNQEGYVDLKEINIKEFNDLSVKINFYSICPYMRNNLCQNYYFGVDVNLLGKVNTFCGGYFNEKDFIPFPVFFCSGYFNKDRFGITFHRVEY